MHSSALFLSALPLVAANLPFQKVFDAQPRLKDAQPYISPTTHRAAIAASIISQLDNGHTPVASASTTAFSSAATAPAQKAQSAATSTRVDLPPKKGIAVTKKSTHKHSKKHSMKHSMKHTKKHSKKHSHTSKLRATHQKRDGTCAPQYYPFNYTPTPNTASGFLNDPYLLTLSTSAKPPAGYSQNFTGQYGSLFAPSYINYYQLPNYNVSACGVLCDSVPSCQGFNTYFERDPLLDPGQACPSPTAAVGVRCALWGVNVNAAQAQNIGEYRVNFLVVVQGSNGYNKNPVPASVTGYKAPVALAAAIDPSTIPSSAGVSYLGYTFLPNSFDPWVCAKYCASQTAASIASNPTSYSACNYFNAFTVTYNNTAQGMYCQAFTGDASAYATAYSQVVNGVTYGLTYSYGYAATNPDNGPVSSSISSVANSATAIVSSAVAGAGSAATSAIAGVGPVSSAAASAGGVVSSATSAAVSLASGAGNVAANAGSAATSVAVPIVSSVGNVVASAATSAAAPVVSSVGNIVASVGSLATSAAVPVVSSVAAGVGSVVSSAVGGAVGAVSSAAVAAVSSSAPATAASSAAAGLGGIGSLISNVGSFATSVAAGAVGAVSSVNPVASSVVAASSVATTVSKAATYAATTTQSVNFGLAAVVTTTITPASAAGTVTVQVQYPTPVATCGNTGIAYAAYNAPSTLLTGLAGVYPENYKTKAPSFNGTASYIGLYADNLSTSAAFYGHAGTSSQNIAIDQKFYVFANQPGTYTLLIPYADDIGFAWIGTKAVSGWTRANADINQISNTLSLSSYSISWTMATGSYEPVRIFWTNNALQAELDVIITAPDGSKFAVNNPGTNTGSLGPQIVQFPCNSASGAAFPAWGSES